MKVLGNITSS